MKSQSRSDIASVISSGDGDLLIISGEGDMGSSEDYDGPQTIGDISSRLRTERGDGDRWAYVDTYEGHAKFDL